MKVTDQQRLSASSCHCHVLFVTMRQLSVCKKDRGDGKVQNFTASSSKVFFYCRKRDLRLSQSVTAKLLTIFDLLYLFERRTSHGRLHIWFSSNELNYSLFFYIYIYIFLFSILRQIVGEMLPHACIFKLVYIKIGISIYIFKSELHFSN